jgi:kynurenine 3-monooxygenase
LLNEYDDDWEQVLPRFQHLRKPDADAIAQLALDNFVEMRDLVGDRDFLLRKKIEAKLHELYPEQWIPLYSQVTFYDTIRYSEAYKTGQLQKRIMDEVMSSPNIENDWQQLDFKAIVNRLTV